MQNFKRNDNYRIAAFDLDHTLLKANCSFKFGLFLFKKGELRFFKMIKLLFLYILQKYGFISVKSLHQTTFNCFFHRKLAVKIEDYADQFLFQNLQKLINRRVYQDLLDAKQQGIRTIILSSSPDILVKKIAQHFNVDYWDSTIYKKDLNGCYDSIEKVMEGEDKVVSLKNQLFIHNIDSKDVIAYSDSYLDLPLLNFVGKAVAVNPDAKLIKNIAIAKDPSRWIIIELL